jgi:hypothetical protein
MLDSEEQTVEINLFDKQISFQILSKGTKNQRYSSIHPIKRTEVRKLNLKVLLK